MNPSPIIKKTPKVLMIETGSWGGIWHYTCCLANALSEKGGNLNVVTSEGFEKPFKLNFKITPLLKKNGNYVKNLFQIFRIVRESEPALIHIQSWFSARRDWLPLLIFRAIRVPIVLTAHNLLPHDEEERNAPFMFWAFKRIFRSANTIVVHSKANKQELVEEFKISHKKIAIIPHGNYRFFSQKYDLKTKGRRHEFLKNMDGKRLFLIFGTMRNYKGIDLALRAMSCLPELERMHLVVAGKPYRNVLEECTELAEHLGILGHVTFMPGYFNYEEVAKFHTAADVILFPYRNIFQSGSLQTALAFGKAIVATSVGSFPETLNEKNSWMVEPDSSSSLANAMKHAVAASQRDLSFMGRESLRVSTEEHDWREIAIKTEELYLNLI